MLKSLVGVWRSCFFHMLSATDKWINLQAYSKLLLNFMNSKEAKAEKNGRELGIGYQTYQLSVKRSELISNLLRCFISISVISTGCLKVWDPRCFMLDLTESKSSDDSISSSSKQLRQLVSGRMFNLTAWSLIKQCPVRTLTTIGKWTLLRARSSLEQLRFNLGQK